jgi:type IV secretory pathway VirB10-like protein
VTDGTRQDGEPSGGSRPAEEMRLRSSRPSVTRLSRRVLLGLGTAAALGIGGALFFALKPHHQTAGSELYNTNNRNTPDGLTNLPRDYTGLPKPVPQLGPPLPGDLGRPILNSGASAPNMPTGTDPEQQRIAQTRGGADQSSLHDDECPPNFRNGAGSSPGWRDAHRRDGGFKRSDLARPQTRVPQLHRRPPHHEPGPCPAGGKQIHSASGCRDPRGTDHRPALRPSWPGHRSCDGRRL